MPYKRRIQSGTDVYHIMARGIARENIFYQNREKNYFQNIIRTYLDHYAVKIYAYCIMSNHVHMILHVEFSKLSFFMARVLADYAFYYNNKHERSGHVFQNRFKSECIETESYFWSCLRYIHMNPVKAGLSATAAGYKFSSMKGILSGQDRLLDQEINHMMLKRFGNHSEFENFHKDREYEIFSDTYEEMELQRLEIAEKLAEEIYIKEHLSQQTQIFEEKIYRAAYMDKIQKTMNISKRKARLIYEKMKRQIRNN